MIANSPMSDTQPDHALYQGFGVSSDVPLLASHQCHEA